MLVYSAISAAGITISLKTHRDSPENGNRFVRWPVRNLVGESISRNGMIFSPLFLALLPRKFPYPFKINHLRSAIRASSRLQFDPFSEIFQLIRESNLKTEVKLGNSSNRFSGISSYSYIFFLNLQRYPTCVFFSTTQTRLIHQ